MLNREVNRKDQLHLLIQKAAKCGNWFEQIAQQGLSSRNLKRALEQVDDNTLTLDNLSSLEVTPNAIRIGNDSRF